MMKKGDGKVKRNEFVLLLFISFGTCGHGYYVRLSYLSNHSRHSICISLVLISLDAVYMWNVCAHIIIQ